MEFLLLFYFVIIFYFISIFANLYQLHSFVRREREMTDLKGQLQAANRPCMRYAIYNLQESN